MSLETGTRIEDLVPTNPVGATDFVQQGDDHIRLIKVCLQGSLPNLGPDAVTKTAAQLNDGAQLTGGNTFTGNQGVTGDVTASGTVQGDDLIATDDLTVGGDQALTGKLLHGTGGVSVSIGGEYKKQQFGTDTPSAGTVVMRGSNDAGGPRIAFGKSRNASYGSRTIVQASDVLGQVAWFADDGTNMATMVGDMYLTAAGSPATGIVPAVFSLRLMNSGGTLAERFTVNTTGCARAGDGAVSTPTFSFISDTNSGMYSGGADILNWSTGGTLRATVNASGAWTFTGFAFPSINLTANAESVNIGHQINNASGSRRLEMGYLGSSAGGAYGVSAGNSFINAVNGLNLCSNDALALSISTSQVVSIYDPVTTGLKPAGFKDIEPGTFNTSTTQNVNHAGTLQRYVGGSGDTWTTYTATRNGETVTIVNNGGGALTISCAATMRWFSGSAVTDTSGGTRSLAVGGVATLVGFGSGANNWMIFGSGIS